MFTAGFDLNLVMEEFQMREQVNSNMEVMISTDTFSMGRNSLITLANPISLRITPLTIDAALAMNINITDTFQGEYFNRTGKLYTLHEA